jgi:Bifunctional DNA primase/polymerase, N-terminal
MSPTLEKLYRIFGQNVVLLPMPKGRKGPLISDWQLLTFTDTQKPDYQKALEYCVECGGNIGVLLGPASEGLISIDLDRNDLVDPFIGKNPIMASTTRTKGKRGVNFFVRIKPRTSYPNSQATYALRDAEGTQMWRMAMRRGG